MRIRRILMCMAIGLGMSAASSHAQPQMAGINFSELTAKQMKELAVEQTDMMKEALELDAAQYKKVLQLNLNRIKVLRNTSGGFGGGFGGPMGGPGGFRPGMGGPGGFRPGMGPGRGPAGANIDPERQAGARELVQELTKEQQKYEAKLKKILTLQQLRKFQENRTMGSIRRGRPEGEWPQGGPGGFRPGMGGPGRGPAGGPGGPGGFRPGNNQGNNN